MSTLEEQLLQKNAPGRYSTWNEYNETSRGDDEESDDNHEPYIDQAPSATATATAAAATTSCTTTCQDYDQYHGQGRGQSSNTGVKGVLSDHRHAKALEKIELANDIQQRKEAFRNATEAAWMMPGEESISISAMRLKERQETVVVSEQMRNMNLHSNGDGDGDNSSEEEDDDSFDDDDDDFMKAYYQQRMTQMSASASASEPPRATYGSVTELNDLIHFSNVIDDTNPETYCVFHIYECANGNDNDNSCSDRVSISIPCCQLMNEHLDQLSHGVLQHTRFFRLRAHKVKENFDPVGFPCVLIYKNGKEVANLTPLTDHSHFHHHHHRDSDRDTSSTIGGDLTRGRGTNCRFTMEDVQHVLSLHGVKD
eukprot:186821_1